MARQQCPAAHRLVTSCDSQRLNDEKCTVTEYVILTWVTMKDPTRAGGIALKYVVLYSVKSLRTKNIHASTVVSVFKTGLCSECI